MKWPRRSTSADHRVAWLTASWCLEYPDETLLGRIPLVRSALDEQSDHPSIRGLVRFLDHLGSSTLGELIDDYVDTFDLSRKQTLYLSYWTDGDTRRRGSALGEFKTLYRDSGHLVDLHGELPDHLPIVLEFAARVDPAAGARVLEKYRPALELIRFALQDRRSPYTDVLAAICSTLPGESPADQRAARALTPALGVESVGLEPFDPRLLPLSTTAQTPMPSIPMRQTPEMR
ncbi:nitrate reductase molybdenum cofactor assembly chaperone [Gordonia otitidis]|uniref:nitrate reductase molybdenum cofactor assembly chaperone n=1 Tax=Gordonia otitidis TaxID=249058 RepID=UPI001D155808|nr:nitrate reductase molybdenum cofactor assembly chaperone [Gordonia otitidis]UEA58126.1 nitrate reductase molybdenum cofactor assembly chaperone [Gordonia otitidis]